MTPGDTAGTNGNESKTLKNKPKPSSLRQQKLPAWQPILTAWTVIPAVLAVGVIFIPIGIALYLASDSVHEYKIDYTECVPASNGICPTYTINVTEDMKGDVYVYYYLENFYQNHRRYVKSRDDKQYLGNLESVSSDCEPFDKINGFPIAPCGAIANSKFNDTYVIRSVDILLPVPLTTTGVLWSVDKDKKFKNPPIPEGKTLCDAFKGTVKPPNWGAEPCTTGGFEDVDFIVWMRTAALPNFRKLWRLLDRTKDIHFANGLPKGKYEVIITSQYNVTGFGGRKALIISTTSWAGGKNSFLGIAYLVVGCLAIVIAIVFVFIHVKFGHSVNELSNVSITHQ